MVIISSACRGFTCWWNKIGLVVKSSLALEHLALVVSHADYTKTYSFIHETYNLINNIIILLSFLYHVLLFNRFVYHINIYTTYIQSTKMEFAPLSTADNYFRCCRAFLKFTKDKKKTLNTKRGNLVISSNQCYLSLFSVSLKWWESESSRVESKQYIFLCHQLLRDLCNFHRNLHKSSDQNRGLEVTRNWATTEEIQWCDSRGILE